MKSEADTVVWEIAGNRVSNQCQELYNGKHLLIKMEEEAMQAVFDKSPNEESKTEAGADGKPIGEPFSRQICTVGDWWSPDERYHPPGGHAERLKEVPKERSRSSSLVVSRPVDLLEIELLGEASEPNLHQKWLVQVEKFVSLVVFGKIGVP